DRGRGLRAADLRPHRLRSSRARARPSALARRSDRDLGHRQFRVAGCGLERALDAALADPLARRRRRPAGGGRAAHLARTVALAAATLALCRFSAITRALFRTLRRPPWPSSAPCPSSSPTRRGGTSPARSSTASRRRA